MSGRRGRLPDLKRLPPTWSGAAPGNLIFACVCFPPKAKVTLAPSVTAPMFIWALAFVYLYSLPYLSTQSGGLLLDPHACCWRDSGFPWNPPHWRLLSRNPLCSLPEIPGCCCIKSTQGQLLLSFLSLFLNCRTTVHLMCIWSFPTSLLLNFHFRLAHNNKVSGGPWWTVEDLGP